MLRLAFLASMLAPCFSPDDGAGGGADTGASGGGASGAAPDIADDPAISLLLGGDDVGDDLFGLDDDASSGEFADGDAVEADEDFDPADPFGLGDDEDPAPDDDETPEADDAEDAPEDEEPDDAPEADDAPAALSESLAAALRDAVPDAVVTTERELVERVQAVETANRDMRGLQDQIDAVLTRHPGLEQVLEDLMRAPAEGEEPVGLLEALGRHVDGLDIDEGAVEDPAEAKRAAREKGKLDAFRAQQKQKAGEQAQYLTEYAAQAERDFEPFAAETFARADGTPDTAATEQFVRALVRFEKGDPATGRLMPPAEKMRAIYRGLNFDALVAKAEAGAEARGRAAGRAEALKGRSTPRKTGAAPTGKVHRSLGSGGAAPKGGARDPLGLGAPAQGVNHDAF